MEQRLAAALTEFLVGHLDAGGSLDRYGVCVDGAAEDGSSFDLTLTFRSGERYCCAEPGCHLGLNEPKVWQTLRQVLGRHGLAGIPPMTVRTVRVVVEPGAVLGDRVKSMKPRETGGYSYEAGPYSERIA